MRGEWSTSGAAESHEARAQRWLRSAHEDLAVAEAPGNAASDARAVIDAVLVDIECMTRP